MKKISVAVTALFAVVALGACTEVPVKQVTKCAKVVDVKLFKSYLLGIIESRTSPELYKVLDNGKRVMYYNFDEDYQYYSNMEKRLRAARTMEVGTDYCWTEYERIK